MIASKIEMRNDGENSAGGIYLGIGSNLGDRETNLRRAAERVESLGFSITRASSIYETEPVGYLDQPWFLNQVIEITAVSNEASINGPVELLGRLLDIEREMGRSRGIRDGPRPIDIDLLLYRDVVLSLEEVVLPHPRMHARRFVLEPMSEIAPGVIHPALGKTMSELLAALKDSSEVRFYKRF